jgi:2',3'-cyclic-nucleotide 2'-phosphodiesterase (5'-nucleotidase family)
MKKLVFSTLTGIVILAACNGAGTADNSDSTLTFIHLNDTYRIDAVEDGNRGGFGRVATIVKNLKEDGRDVRILHGGDFLFPSLESQLWAGEQMVEALNYLDVLAPMYIVPGNHEFDPRSPDAVINAMRGSEFDWLGDNMRLATGQDDVDNALRQAFTFESNSRTIGVFALTLLPEDGGNDRDYAPVDKPYLETAEAVIESFQAAGVDVVIGLTHLHIADDIRIAALREKYPNFLFIVGGHEHEPEYQALTDDSAAIMKGASNARTIWQIDLRFGANGETPHAEFKTISVDQSIEEDAAYVAISDRWRARLLELIPFLPSRIGNAAVPLDGREVAVRNEESNWGNFIVDQMRTAFRDPPAELAFINSGTLRIDDFVAGDITFEDIGRTFGFSSFLRYMTITGADFKTLLEAGYRGEGPSKGYFPQLSGFRVCVDRSRPDGERIVQLQLPGEGGWRQIEDERDYSLVAPDYIYRGGDGYDFSKARDVSRPGSELRYLVLDAVIRAQAQGEAVGEAVDPANPRIAFLSPDAEQCFD